MNNTNNYFSRVNDLFAGLAEWIIDHRKFVIIVCGIIGVMGIVLSLRIKIDNSMDVYFRQNDPTYVDYQNFIEEYGNDQFIYIVYRVKQGIFDLDALHKTKMLVKDLEKVPFVEKVNAVTNIEIIEGNKNGAINVYGLMDDFPSNQSEAHPLMQKLLDKPLYVNGYISDDASYAAILCEVKDKPKDDQNYQMKIFSGLKNVLSKQEYKEFEFWPVGEPIVASEWNVIREKDTLVLSVLVFVAIAILLILFFRQAKGVIGPLAVVSFSTVLVFGFMGINSFSFTGVSVVISPLLLSIGVATTVHFINKYQFHLRSGLSNRTSIIEAVRMVAIPCFFTSITTAIGFGSMIISPIPAISEYGSYLVFGLLVIFFLSVTILLVILSFSGEKTEMKYINYNVKTKSNGFIDSLLKRIGYLNRSYSRLILIIASIIGVISIYGITRLQINASMLEQLGDSLQVTHDYEFVDKTMAGTGSFEIVLDSNKLDGVKTQKFVQILESIQKFALTQDYLVRKTSSVVDIIKEVNSSLHNNDKAFYRIPSSDDEVSQYILLYEISGGEELEKLVSADLAAARLTIYVKSTDSIIAKRFYDEIVNYIESVKPDDYSYRITGFSYLMVEMMDYVGRSQRQSLLLALIIISALMILIFRSVKMGLISMIPNIFPTFFILGFMGASGIILDHARSMLAPIAIGLAVDDTIHLIYRYQLEFKRLGRYEKALDAALSSVGRAILITTIILVLGFFIMMVSEMNNISYFGMLSGICIFIALLSDYFIAPSLILLFKPFGKEFDPEEKTAIGT
ncbi:MAG: MMPL family transporter [Spirochaetota bacterium]|nr:MMPL family transporter [Spirochaetota bacterium]